MFSFYTKLMTTVIIFQRCCPLSTSSNIFPLPQNLPDFPDFKLIFSKTLAKLSNANPPSYRPTCRQELFSSFVELGPKNCSKCLEIVNYSYPQPTDFNASFSNNTCPVFNKMSCQGNQTQPVIAPVFESNFGTDTIRGPIIVLVVFLALFIAVIVFLVIRHVRRKRKHMERTEAITATDGNPTTKRRSEIPDGTTYVVLREDSVCSATFSEFETTQVVQEPVPGTSGYRPNPKYEMPREGSQSSATVGDSVPIAPKSSNVIRLSTYGESSTDLTIDKAYTKSNRKSSPKDVAPSNEMRLSVFGESSTDPSVVDEYGASYDKLASQTVHANIDSYANQNYNENIRNSQDDVNSDKSSIGNGKMDEVDPEVVDGGDTSPLGKNNLGFSLEGEEELEMENSATESDGVNGDNLNLDDEGVAYVESKL